MYINIKRRIFQKDPAERFADLFDCKPQVWRKVWHRYKFMNYTRCEAREYLNVILKIPVRSQTFNLWVDRTEIYLKAQLALDKGIHTVQSEFFGKYKQFVEREVTKNKLKD